MTPAKPAPKPLPIVEKRKAFSYLRFSSPEQMKGDSLRRQTARAEEYVRSQNGRLVLDTELTFSDLGVSAFRGKNAETGRLGDFLEAVKRGLVPQGSVLLVESLDRVSRQSARFAVRVLEDLCDAGVSVVTLSDGREYTAESLSSDPMALLLAILTFIRANEESVMKASRLRAAWDNKRTKAASGERMTSMLPAWLQTAGKGQPVTVNEERAEVVRRVFKLYSEGMGVVAITMALNQDKVPTFETSNRVKAKAWHPSYVNRLLRNPAVVGTFQPATTFYEGKTKRRKPAGEAIPGYYPPVVDGALFSQVQAMLADTCSPTRGKPARELQNVLGGLVTCAKCGSSMRRKTIQTTLADGKRHLYAYLVCTNASTGGGCKYEAVRYDTVEACFLEQAPALFAQCPAPADDSGLEAQLRVAQASLEALEEHRVKLRDLMLATGSRSLAGDLQATENELEKLTADRDALQAKLEAAAGPLLDGRLADLRAALAEETLDKRKVNALLRSVLSRVDLDNASRQATLVWKHGGASGFIFGLPAENS